MTKVSSVGIITVLRILNITALPTAKTAFFDELEKHFSFCIRSEKRVMVKVRKKSTTDTASIDITSPFFVGFHCNRRDIDWRFRLFGWSLGCLLQN